MKKFSKILLITGVFISTLSLSAQNPKEISFKKTLQEVVQLCIKKDSLSLKQYIDKNTGVFIIYRPGVADMYSNYENLIFNETGYPYIIVPSGMVTSVVKYNKLPSYDCEKMRWSKVGCYVDTTRTDHLLSSTAKNMVKFFEIDIKKETIEDIEKLESKSRRVVIVSPNGDSFVLYLSYINNKWYLTIVDLVTDDCSA